MPHVMRNRLVAGMRGSGITGSRRAFPLRGTGNTVLMRSIARPRLAMIHVSRRLRNRPLCVMGNRRIVGMGSLRMGGRSLACGRPRNGMRRIRSSAGRMRDARILRPVPLVGIVVRSSIDRGIVCYRGVSRGHYPGTMEGSWLGRGGDSRTAVIDRCQLRALRGRHLLMLGLYRGGSHVPLSQHIFLSCGRPDPDASMTSVVADPVNRDIVDYPGVVGIVNVRYIHMVHRAVVIELPVAPIATVIAIAGIAITVIDTAVEPDLRTPVTGVPDIG